MRNIPKTICVIFAIPVFLMCASTLYGSHQLKNHLIRFHVIANSDSQRDQEVKLQVRDAVIMYIQDELQGMPNAKAAKDYLRQNCSRIQNIANETLYNAGFAHTAEVTVCTETFPVRTYETFALPAGVYNSLRITIGEGEGRNWWCVAFPDLCLPATSAGFLDSAVEAGLSDTLCKTLSSPEDCEIRFFLLDALGRLENILWEIE